MKCKKFAITMSCLAISLPALANHPGSELNCYAESQTHGGEPMVYHVTGKVQADPYNWNQYNLVSNLSITIEHGTKVYARNKPLRRVHSHSYNYNNSVWSLDSSVYGLEVTLSEPLSPGASISISHTLDSHGKTLHSHSTCDVGWNN